MFNLTLYQEVFYQSKIPQLIVLIDFSKVQYNPAFGDFIGYSLDELTSIPVESVSYPDDMPRDTQLFGEILSGHRDEYQLEKRYIHKSGEIKTGILTISRVCEQSTGEEFLIGQILDITEKKQMEVVMKNREVKYRLIAEHSSDMIMLHKVDFSYQYISPSVKTVLGFEPEEMLGKCPTEFIHPADHEELKKQHMLSVDNNSLLLTYRCRNKNGSYIWLESTIKALFDTENGEIKEIISVSRDIQHRMETNERLRKSEKLAVVGQMAAAVAHKIRNPLTPIKGFMQLLKSEKEINPVYLKIVLDELHRVELIISEFLSMAKPYTEKTTVVSVDNLVRQVVQLLQSQAPMEKMELNFFSGQAVPPIMGNSNSLKRVFMNVIQNALDALSEKGRIDVSIMTDETGVTVKVTDNGCGSRRKDYQSLGSHSIRRRKKERDLV